MAVGSVLLDLGDRERARELATSVLASADMTAPAASPGCAVELSFRVAGSEQDLRGARELIDALESELEDDLGFAPRHRALCWLLLSEAVEAEHVGEALDAAERALALSTPTRSSTPRMRSHCGWRTSAATTV